MAGRGPGNRPQPAADRTADGRERRACRSRSRRESFDARWDALTGRSQTRAIVSPQGWLTVSTGDSSQTYLSWADAKERGSLAGAMLLGRVRASKPADLQQPPLDLGAGTMSPLDLSYVGYSVQLNLEGEHQTLLVLKHPNLPQNEIRILVDTARHVILKIENIALPSLSGRGAGGRARSTRRPLSATSSRSPGPGMPAASRTSTPTAAATSITTQKFTALAAGQFDRAVEAGPGRPRTGAIAPRTAAPAGRCQEGPGRRKSGLRGPDRHAPPLPGHAAVGPRAGASGGSRKALRQARHALGPPGRAADRPQGRGGEEAVS